MNNRAGARLCRFLTVGAVATAMQFALLHLAVRAGMHPLLGSTVSYMISAVFNYSTNRKWTFGYEGRHAKAVVKFTMVVVLSLLANSTVFFLAMSYMHYLVAQLFATAAAVIVNYLGNTYWTFRTESREGMQPD